MLLRLSLVLFVLLLSLAGCEQQDKGTETNSTPEAAAPTETTPPAEGADTTKEAPATPAEGGATETQPNAEGSNTTEPAGDAGATKSGEATKEEPTKNPQ